ncbi:MAG TPA: TatD family hydrolase [Steroidobacteraceae bacterium]|nr:TatD family hydrolase [Steroidobacteraceae bacterium]
MTIDLIDIGSNLAHQSFDEDRSEVLRRAAAAGVVQQVVTGADLLSSRSAAQLAAAHPSVLYSTAGVHPHHAARFDRSSRADFHALLERAEVVAIGECGLDYYRDFSPRDAQRSAFVAQLDLAAEVRKPVFLHQRDAHADFIAILREYLPAPAGGVAHCFTGGRRELDDYLELGLSIGITGWVCDERRGSALREAVAHIPLERLLLETDAPYLLPRDLVPKSAARRNEPAFLPHIARAVAMLRGAPFAALAAASSANARRLFGLAGATGS